MPFLPTQRIDCDGGLDNQCDQIWQNFATLTQFKSLGQMFEGSISFWQ